jgi:hypothetical protein
MDGKDRFANVSCRKLSIGPSWLSTNANAQGPVSEWAERAYNGGEGRPVTREEIRAISTPGSRRVHPVAAAFMRESACFLLEPAQAPFFTPI